MGEDGAEQRVAGQDSGTEQIGVAGGDGAFHQAAGEIGVGLSVIERREQLRGIGRLAVFQQ